MGTKWMIEKATGISMWWTGCDWTPQAHAGLSFDTHQEALDFIDRRFRDGNSPFKVPVIVTEHIFMSPLSTAENLN